MLAFTSYRQKFDSVRSHQFDNAGNLNRRFCHLYVVEVRKIESDLTIPCFDPYFLITVTLHSRMESNLFLAKSRLIHEG